MPKSALGAAFSAARARCSAPLTVSSALIGCALTPEGTATGSNLIDRAWRKIFSTAIRTADTLAAFVEPTAKISARPAYDCAGDAAGTAVAAGEAPAALFLASA